METLFSAENIRQLIVSAFFAGAMYAGIRADIRHIHEKVNTALKSASRAHERIDSHLDKKD